MKKLNPKILGITFMLFSILIAGGIGIKNMIAPGGTGITDDSNPHGGGN